MEFTPGIEDTYERLLLTEVNGTLAVEEKSSQRSIADVQSSQSLEEDDWLLIRPVGAPSFIPVPFKTPLLELVFDYDDSCVALKVCGTRQYVQRSTLENHFDANWTTLLDDDSVLTPMQLQQGIDIVELIVNDAIADSFKNREGSK